MQCLLLPVAPTASVTIQANMRDSQVPSSSLHQQAHMSTIWMRRILSLSNITGVAPGLHNVTTDHNR